MQAAFGSQLSIAGNLLKSSLHLCKGQYDEILVKDTPGDVKKVLGTVQSGARSLEHVMAQLLCDSVTSVLSVETIYRFTAQLSAPSTPEKHTSILCVDNIARLKTSAKQKRT